MLNAHSGSADINANRWAYRLLPGGGGVTGFLGVMGIQTVYDWAICWAGRTGLSLGIGSPDPV